MHATGDENCGVHVCRKCRWPFPNPHPSSRHRRAHKRVCGTIEGYKLNDSENPSLSDEDRHSDENHKTLSPKVVDRNGAEKRSSGIGERSNRSEDEVFSDAVTDFPDSGFSPATEEELGGTQASLTSVENIDEKDLTTTYSFKDSAFSDIIESPNNLSDSSMIQNPGISGSTSNMSGSHLESQVHVCTPHEEPIAFLGDDKVKLTSETYSTVAETPTPSSQETKVINAVNDATQGMVTHAGEVNDAKQNDKINLVTSGAATSITEYAGQTDGTVCKSQETMEMQLDHMAANEVLSEEQGESTTFKMSTVEHVNFDDTDRSKVVAEQGLESNVSVNLNEGYNGSGNEKDVYEISVPSDIPVVEHANIMLEDFKDHKGVKLHNPVPLTLAEIDQKNDVEELFSIDNFTSFQQVQPCEVTKASASDMNILDDNVTHEHNRSVVNDLSTTGESGLHHVKFTGKEQSDDLGASAEALIVETEKSLKTGVSENQQPCDTNNKHSDTSVPENAVKVSNDMSSLHDCGKGGNVIVMHDAIKDGNTMPVHDATKDGNTVHVHDASKDAIAVVVPDVANYTEAGAVRYSATDAVLAGNGNMNRAGKDEKALDAICSVDEKDDKVRVKEENHTKNVATIFESAADPITNSYESDVTGGSGKGKPSNCDVLGVEDKVVPTEVMHALKKSEMVLESASTLPESQLVTEDVVNVSANKLPETEITNRDGVLDTRDGVGELRIVSVDQSQEFTSENGKAVIIDKSLEEHSKNVLPSCLYTEPSMQDSVSGGNNHAGELTEEDSVIKESKRERINTNDFVKPQIGAAVDVADSLSHTDSLENNWGSISVLSTQSDTPPVVDTQSAASVVAEGTNSQKPNVVSEGQQSEKSDVFEAPSFMTLVEPGGEGDRNSASDIKILPNTQQQNAASLQAGWFPSLTHVVNESQGRKKNEEIIAKVTNWSSGKQHTPLKYLLGEAKSPNRKDSQASEVEKDETKAAKDNGSAPAKAAKDNGSAPTTVSSILGPEGELGNTKKEKDWNSPARYQTDIKREKRRPLWVQFICCSSMN